MRQLTINYTSWLEYAETLRKREPFKTFGSLEGSDWPTATWGQLPEPWRALYLASLDLIDYVVLSYQTPIAWHIKGQGWVAPPVKYSVTTSKQQSRIFTAVAQLNEEGDL